MPLIIDAIIKKKKLSLPPILPNFIPGTFTDYSDKKKRLLILFCDKFDEYGLVVKSRKSMKSKNIGIFKVMEKPNPAKFKQLAKVTEGKPFMTTITHARGDKVKLLIRHKKGK